jgi:hypothetical protein
MSAKIINANENNQRNDENENSESEISAKISKK